MSSGTCPICKCKDVQTYQSNAAGSMRLTQHDDPNGVSCRGGGQLPGIVPDCKGYQIPPDLCNEFLNALRVAADRFEEDAKNAREVHLGGGLADQFDRQATAARKLYDLFENYDSYPIVVKYMSSTTKPEPTEAF